MTRWQLGAIMEPVADVDRVQEAFDAAAGGDVEPLVGLMAPGFEWRGIERGHLWWRRAPS
ncbi:MAG TPA: hypothetical protein VHT75_15100 [Acidimicrobiales bacterium]|jgi:ketosteroid isomerase-like protein|nr:hypothetical protein [Acidimicrobiales bacterium]